MAEEAGIAAGIANIASGFGLGLMGELLGMGKEARRKQPSLEFVTPPQLGELVLFLCSEAGSQVRGAAWNIDGGWLAQ